MNATDCCAKCRLWERDDNLWHPLRAVVVGTNPDPFGKCLRPEGMRLDVGADDESGLFSELMTLPDFCCRGFIARD